MKHLNLYLDGIVHGPTSIALLTHPLSIISMSDIDLVSMVGGLSVEKSEDTDSIADSALGTSSGATFAGVSQLSEVRHQ